MKFADVIGHEDLKSEFRRMIDTDRIPHALLLGGMQGVGKMRLVRAALQYLYCTGRHDGEPCGKCPACLQTSRLNNPDIHWVYPVVKLKNRKATISADFADQWREMLDKYPYMEPERWNDLMDAGNSRPAIFVDEAAEITAKAPLSGFAYRYKTYVIWLPELMRAETANSLLKLIEEPYEDTIFILVSDNPSELLPTVFSRTRRLNARPVDRGEIHRWLVGTGIPAETAAQAARLCGGAPGRALEIAANSGEQGEFGDIYRTMMRRAYSREVAALKTLSEEVAAMGREKNMRFLEYCNRMARENFIANFTIPPLNTLNDEEQRFSMRFAPFVNFRNIERLSAETDRAQRDIGRNANAKIVMFDYMLSLCSLIRVVGQPKT